MNPKQGRKHQGGASLNSNSGGMACTIRGPRSVFESGGAEPKVGGGAEQAKNHKCMVIFAFLYTLAEKSGGAAAPPAPPAPRPLRR